MDKRTEKILSIILYVSIVFTLGFSITFNTQNKVILGILSSMLLVTVSIRYMIVYPSVKYGNLGRFMILFDLALVYWIVLIDKSGISQLYLLALLSDVILNSPISYSGIVALASYLSYICSAYIRDGYPPFESYIPYTLFSASTFMFVFGIVYLTKYQIVQKAKLSSAIKEIQTKNQQLEDAYKKLKETSEALEEMTALKERNRIAREIHDTVGHTLTTVLVEIEAGKRLASKNPVLAQEKLELAQEQVRKGLSDIRHSVRMLKDRGAILDFIPAMESLIHESEKHTGISINYNIQMEKQISKELEDTLYNCLLEGLTNGIKHGNSTKFDFKLYAKDKMIYFELLDNGSGCENIVPGFGLSAMRDRLELLGGILNINSNANEGCKVSIEIPLKECNNL